MIKRFKQRKNLGLVAVALALVLALMVGGCAPSAPVEEEKVVKIGLHSVFTGALASTGVPAYEGMIDSARYITEQGGIGGIKVKTMWEETGGTVPKSITAHRRFVEKGVLVEQNIIGSQVEALGPASERDQIPMFLVTYRTPPMVGNRWIFTGTPGIRDDSALMVRWVKENWREPRPLRVASMGYDHLSEYECMEGVKWAAEQWGLEFVGYEYIPFMGTIDTSTEWLRLIGKKPDFIHGTYCGASSVTMVKDAARLGIKEKAMLSESGYCIGDIIPIVGEDAEGWYCPRWAPTLVQTDIPAVRTLIEAAKKYRGYEVERIRPVYVNGWIQTLVTCEGIRLAIEKVGLENLDGKAVRDGLASIEDFDTGFIPPVTMSDDKPWFTAGMRVYQVQGGQLRPISDFFGYPGATKEWYPGYKEWK